jgi:hypothetical protein
MKTSKSNKTAAHIRTASVAKAAGHGGGTTKHKPPKMPKGGRCSY